MDLGVGPSDLAEILSGAGVDSRDVTETSMLDSNYYTALTVFVSLRALLQERRRGLAGSTVLVEGLGKVSSQLVRMLDDEGAKVVGVSTLAVIAQNVTQKGRFAVILDARRGSCFGACFERTQTTVVRRSEDAVLPPETFLASLDPEMPLVGTGAGTVPGTEQPQFLR